MANDVNNCWAKLDKTAGSGNETLHVYFDENNTGANRSVKIRAYDKTGEAVSEYTLVQLPKEATIYYNTEQTDSFQRTNCPSGYVGTYVEYTIPVGTYSSTVSVEDANRKAREALALEGPAYANVHGECNQSVWKNQKMTKQYQKTGCDPDTEEGSMVDFTVEAGRFTSTVSQADADKQAEEYLDANGPAYANEHGECITVKWYNDAQSGRFQRTDCLSTETGSFVDYTVEAGRFSSTVSKKDANDKAKEALAIEGPEYANEHGTCEESTWYNEEQRETFYKKGCPAGQIGAPYEYVVEAGKYSSTVSQEDANQKALDEIAENGQATANLEGECVQDPNYFIGKASARVQKNDCDPETQNGSWVDLTEKDLPGYPDAYVSHSSQPEADALAEAAMELHKQELANEKGTCIDKDLFIGVYSEPFQKTDCVDGGVGSMVEVDQDDVQEYGPFESYESQEAANKLAEAAVKAHGEEIANRDGYCTWTGTASGEYCKTDCEEGQKGSCMTLTERDLTGYPDAFKSTESLDAANALAEAALAEQGPAIANNRGNCEDATVYTGHAEETYTPDCGHCKEAPDMLVTAEMVNGSPVISYISQPDADQKAQQILEEGGQNYANKNADCQPSDATPNWVDTDPLETECREGVSYKKQIDQNECSLTYNTEQWVPGGDKTCSWVGTCDPLPTQKTDCEDGKQGTIVEVTVEMCEGYPEGFTSIISEEDANTKACQLLAERAQAVANAQGSCNDCFSVVEKTWYKTDCPSCQEDLKGIFVSAEDVGGPFCAPDYDAETAQTTYDTLAQAYANKNIASCTPKPVDPDWQNVEPAEFECQEGKSMQKQQDMNECSGTYQEFRWVEGGDLTCQWTAPDSSQEYTRTCDGTGVGGTVTVASSELDGYPFVSYESPEDAERMRDEAFAAQGEAIASGKPGWTCTWTSEWTNQQITRTDCDQCEKSTEYTVTIESIGGPFTSNVSQADANQQAQTAFNEQKDALASKNCQCVNDPAKDSPNWTNTSTTRCNNCSSEVMQRDTNPCSSSYNDTRYVSGGSRDCSESGSWGSKNYSSGYCGGSGNCTWIRPYTQTNSCGGTRSGSDDTPNSSNCGSWGDWSWRSGDCSGNQAIYRRTHSCTGEEETDLRLEDGKCGYSECDCAIFTASVENISSDSHTNYELQSAQGVSYLYSGCRADGGVGFESYRDITSITSNQSWLTNLKAEQNGVAGVKVTCNVSENTTYSSRTATITVRNDCGLTDTLSVTQEGREHEYVFNIEGQTTMQVGMSWDATESWTSPIGLVTSTRDGEGIGCSVSLNTGSSWLDVNLAQSPGQPEYHVIQFMAKSENTTSSDRTSMVTLKQEESGKTILLIVTQSYFSGSCSITGTISVTENQINVTNLKVTGSDCGSSFSGGCLILTITGGNFLANGAYYTLDSSKENATISLSTTGRSFSMPFQYHSGYDLSSIHVSGSKCTSGNEGDCGGCNLEYTLTGGN